MRILVNALGRDVHPTGICRVAANHVRALLNHRSGDHVAIAVGSWQQEMFRLLLGNYAHQVDFFTVDIKNSSLARNYWYSTSMPQLAKTYLADIVHHSYPAPIFRRAFSSPVVVTLHDLYPYDIPENFGFPNYYANRLILRQCLSNVDGVACVSKTTKHRMNQIFPAASNRMPVVVTGNYIQMSDDEPTPPAIAAELSDTPFLLTVAQHRKNKNLDLLLRGFRELLDRQASELALVIVGSKGPETPHLLDLVETLALKDRVKFVHSISDPELRWLYQNSTLVVLCSSIEGYCLPAAEALANHAKLVCSDIEILREIAGEQSVYFSLQGDAVRNLARAIFSALGSGVPSTSLDGSFVDSTILARYSHLYSQVLSPA